MGGDGITLPGMTEQLPYTVVRAFPRLDVRLYPACVLVQIRVESGLVRTRGPGTRGLYRYLSGRNTAGRNFGVTAPLFLEPVGEHVRLVSLALPGGTDPDTVPLPLDDAVSIRAVPAHEAAALRMGGGWTAQGLLDRGRVLLAEVHACRLEPVGEVYFARFDPPWKSAGLTRNEALVRVTS